MIKRCEELMLMVVVLFIEVTADAVIAIEDMSRWVAGICPIFASRVILQKVLNK